MKKIKDLILVLLLICLLSGFQNPCLSNQNEHLTGSPLNAFAAGETDNGLSRFSLSVDPLGFVQFGHL